MLLSAYRLLDSCTLSVSLYYYPYGIPIPLTHIPSRTHTRFEHITTLRHLRLFPLLPPAPIYTHPGCILRKRAPYLSITVSRTRPQPTPGETLQLAAHTAGESAPRAAFTRYCRSFTHSLQPPPRLPPHSKQHTHHARVRGHIHTPFRSRSIHTTPIASISTSKCPSWRKTRIGHRRAVAPLMPESSSTPTYPNAKVCGQLLACET